MPVSMLPAAAPTTRLLQVAASFAVLLSLSALASGADWDTQQPPESRFEITVLTRDCANPMEMSIAHDGRIFFCEKFGSIKLYKPTTRETVLVAKLDTYAIENGEKGNTEDGLIGLTLDPDFDTNHWLYVLRAAPGDKPEQHLSRFTLVGDKLDLASEKILLVNPNCRAVIGHCGGCLSFSKGNLYWGEVGPDAGKDGPRGPRGYDEFNCAKGPGYYGWPLFVGDNESYAEYNWDTKAIGAKFDPAHPINDSPRNTGIRELPPAQPAWIYYPYAVSEKFPDLGSGGRCAMSGPVYHRDPTSTSPTRFPGYYDNTLFLYEWMRSWIKAVKLDAKGDQVSMEAFLPSTKLRHPMDMRFGPDGSLYVIEFGNNWWHPDQADIVRIDFVPGNRAPIAKASADVVVGKQPLAVKFSSAGTYDKDEGDTISYAWSFTGKGVESTDPNPSFTFTAPGTYQATLTVTDKGGKTAIAVVPIRVGNAAPKVSLSEPISGHFFRWGETIAYHAAVTDEEDGSTEAGTIPAAQVKVTIGYDAQHEESAADQENGIAAGANQRGRNRVFKSDCIACHQLGVQSVGPSFTAISAKYHGQEGILAKLTDKVITGGGGVWGPIAMAAHPQFTRDEIQEMVGWVLSIADDQGAISGASGSFTTMAKPAKDDRGSYVIQARYTDKGAPGAEPLTGSATITLRSRIVSAADRTSSKGTGTEPCADVGGGQQVINIDADTWLGFKAITLAGTTKLTYRVASGGAGGTIEVHVDSPTGAVISTAAIAPTGSWTKWADVDATIQDPGGTHDLFLVFTAAKGKKKLFNLNWINFHAPGE